MSLHSPRARFFLLLPFALAAPVSAQQLIGYVNTRDASVTGASDVLDDHFVLTGSVSVTAKDHTAPVTLSRGGTVNVCQTSVVHLTESREMTVAAPLLLSLDRGAVEIQMNAAASDAMMTPDLRLTVRNAGPLDLRLRVARNGDTCVENRGAGAPTLAVSDPFGESMYEVPAGRHVLFQHGSLHDVVDNESTPCGCPDQKGMSLADAILNAPVATPAPKPAPPPVATAPTPPPTAPVQTAPPVVVVQAATPQPAPAVAPPVAAPAVKTPAPVVAPAAPPAQTAPVVIQAPPVSVQPPPPAATPQPATAAPTPPPPPVLVVQAPAIKPAPAPVVSPPAAPAPVVVASTTQPVEQAAAVPTEESVEQVAAVAAARAAALHPFPADVSKGVAPVPEPMPAASNNTPAQITDAISYTAPAAAPAPSAAAPAPAPAAKKSSRAKSSTATAQASTNPAQPASSPDLVHLIGNFFRKLFGRG